MLRSSLARIRAIVISTATLAAFVAAPAMADRGKHERGHDHGHGPKIEVKDDGREYKYEYKDRGCKYEYKLNYRTGEEKVKQKGNCRGVSPRRALYPVVEVPVVHDDRDYDHDEPPVHSSRRVACNREVIGAVLGGVAGGIAGSNIGHGDGRKVATVAGAIIGAVIGSHVGRRMDRADEGCAYQALEFASPGETVFWRNPTSQLEYAITPAQLTRRDGRECREYKTSVVGGGVGEKGSSGLACRNSNGAWEIQ